MELCLTSLFNCYVPVQLEQTNRHGNLKIIYIYEISRARQINTTHTTVKIEVSRYSDFPWIFLIVHIYIAIAEAGIDLIRKCDLTHLKGISLNLQ